MQGNWLLLLVWASANIIYLSGPFPPTFVGECCEVLGITFKGARSFLLWTDEACNALFKGFSAFTPTISCGDQARTGRVALCPSSFPHENVFLGVLDEPGCNFHGEVQFPPGPRHGPAFFSLLYSLQYRRRRWWWCMRREKCRWRCACV